MKRVCRLLIIFFVYTFTRFLFKCVKVILLYFCNFMVILQLYDNIYFMQNYKAKTKEVIIKCYGKLYGLVILLITF